MHEIVSDRLFDIAETCRRFGVRRLSVFGSAARGVDFDVDRSDADLLVEFGTWSVHDPYPGLKDELEQVLGRKVDLLDKGALDESRNYIRRSAILGDAEVVYES